MPAESGQSAAYGQGLPRNPAKTIAGGLDLASNSHVLNSAAEMARHKGVARIRHLTIVLGDQLDRQSAAFDGFDNDRDLVWMAEVVEESTHVPSHKVRTALFLSAMRHFAEELRADGRPVEYRKLNARNNDGSFDPELRKAIAIFKPEAVVVVEPGEYRVEELIKRVTAALDVRLEIRPDRHFFWSRAEFASWAKTHAQLRMEFFYREMRKKSGVLMEHAKPEGERWNFDEENRKSFGKFGPAMLLAAPHAFPPDAITREVLSLVEKKFPDNPGSLKHFDFPVTAGDAQIALADFIEHRLPDFGAYQDAMWTNEPYLFHSRISALMNLKLLNPRTVLMAVEEAYYPGLAPPAAGGGFVRQIPGLRGNVAGG